MINESSGQYKINDFWLIIYLIELNKNIIINKKVIFGLLSQILMRVFSRGGGGMAGMQQRVTQAATQAAANAAVNELMDAFKMKL